MADKNKATTINLDNILTELGQFGKFQFLNYMLIVVPVVFAACNNGNYIFTAADMNYRCRIPECGDGMEAIIDPAWLGTAIPEGDRCYRFAPANNSSGLLIPLWGRGGPPGLFNATPDTCSADLFDNTTTVQCEEWVFGPGDTIVKELEIQCHGWKRTLVGTAHSFGLLLALPFVAFVSDRFGRRTALVCSAFMAGVLGLCRSFANNYISFLVFEVLEPTFGSGVYSSAFILGMELVGPRRRVLGATILCMFYSLGAMLLGCFAWILPNWRTLLRVIYTPSLLFIFYFFIIHESVRWLISKGHYEKALAILKKAAKVNGVILTDKSMESLYTTIETQKEELQSIEMDTKEKENLVNHDEVKSPLSQVLHSPIILTRLMTCSFWWITCTFVYYGLSINSVSLAGNIYLNYIFVSLVELPAYLTGYFMLDKIGRKFTLCSSFLASGVACIAFPFLPPDIKWLSLVMYLFGKYFITIAFSSCYVYTSELFPTPLRHSLLGTCSMIGRIGSIVAPQTPLLAEYMASLPSLLFGGCSFISGLLMLTSPETLNIKLPDTIKEAEDIGKKKPRDIKNENSN